MVTNAEIEHHTARADQIVRCQIFLKLPGHCAQVLEEWISSLPGADLDAARGSAGSSFLALSTCLFNRYCRCWNLGHLKEFSSEMRRTKYYLLRVVVTNVTPRSRRIQFITSFEL